MILADFDVAADLLLQDVIRKNYVRQVNDILYAILAKMTYFYDFTNVFVYIFW